MPNEAFVESEAKGFSFKGILNKEGSC